MLTEIEKAWMAGFVDGEGCITICKQVRKNRPSPAYRAFITITNTKTDSLDSFVKEYGGQIYNVIENRKDKRMVKWADAYSWYCPMVPSERFLMDMLPYLRVKGEQAKIVLEFIRTKDGFDRAGRIGPHGSAPLSIEEIEHREALKKKVQLLNKKGQRARETMAQVGVVQ